MSALGHVNVRGVSTRVLIFAGTRPGAFHDTPHWTAHLARLVLAVVVVCKNVAGGHAVGLLEGGGVDEWRFEWVMAVRLIAWPRFSDLALLVFAFSDVFPQELHRLAKRCRGTVFLRASVS